jgi:2Fe-2S ferredoxin
MAKIKIWPHEEICPNGAEIESLPEETICEAALRNNIKIEHACEMSAACTTCHKEKKRLIIRTITTY